MSRDNNLNYTEPPTLPPIGPAPIQPPRQTPVLDSVQDFFDEATHSVRRTRRNLTILGVVAIVGLTIYATRSHAENLKWRESAQGIMGLIEQL